MITDGRPSITSINNFLGLNQNETGETQLKLGEASRMKNFRITKDYKLDKMYGYKELYDPDARVRANWVGNLNGTDMNIYIAGGKAYRDGTQIGTLEDATTSIYEFNKLLFVINGVSRYTYDGTTWQKLVDNPNNNGSAAGYVPTIKISCTPAGVGEDYEPINLLTNYRKVSFSADGTAATFKLPETGIRIHTGHVWVNGASVTGCTFNSENGTVTLPNVPAQGTDNVLVQYLKLDVEPSLAENITKNMYYQKYGLANDTRVFLYGNPDAKNRIYFSDIGNGTPRITYFPATNFIDVGSSNTAVTDISRQYDRLIISKEDETYYMTYEPITDSEGNTIITFPVYPLNKSHGMIAKSQGQLLDNYVTTIDRYGIVQWVSTNTKDERNASIVSTRVNEWLVSKDLTKAVTLDYEEDKEYWLAVDNQVMIYNYANSTFYMLDLPDNVRTLTSYEGLIYMGTDTGLMQFDKNMTTYKTEAIDSEWQGGFYDFEAEYKRKTMRILWIALKPYVRTALSVNYITDRNTGTTDKEIEQNIFSYPYWNYVEFSYQTNNTVKPYKIKLKAKKFAFLKLILKNNNLYSKLTVDSISIQKAYGGFVK